MTAAIVLAAGRGSRLQKYSRHMPKALVRVGGRSLLDWQLRTLGACGIARVRVAGGYRADQLARHDIELVHVAGWADAGPIASLLATNPADLDDDFVVIYADCLHHRLNLRELCASRADIAVAGDREWRALWTERHGDPLIDAETYRADDGALRAIGAIGQDLGEIDAQFAGIVRFTPQGWRIAQRVLACDGAAPADMTGLLSRLLEKDVRIADVAIAGRWCEIDSADDVRLCRRRLREPQRWLHDWRDDADARSCR